MSGILGALRLSNLFSSESGSGKEEPETTSSPQELTPTEAQPTCLLKEYKKPTQAEKDIQNLFEMEASSYSQSQLKFPVKLFNIDIESTFSDMEQSEETKKNFSEMSFLNEDLDEEDGKQSEAEPVPTNIHLKEVEVEDPRISEIINSGVREFQSDYLQKIDAAFQLQVDQMTKIFSNGLAKAHVSFEQQLDKELDNIRKDYANRIIEFDNTTTYYKDSNEVVLTETKKYEEAMAAKILALQLHVQEVEETLQTELKNIVQDEERKLREQRAKEKLEQHEELLESSNMATNRRWVLEEEYKQEIQALEAQSEKLEAENEELEEKIELWRIHAIAEFNRRENLRLIRERDREEAMIAMKALEKKMEALVKENSDKSYMHKVRLTQMIETSSIRADHHNSEYRYFKRILEDVKANFKEDMIHFEQSERIQAEAHAASLEDLKDAYRDKVMNLVQSVYALKRNTDRFCAQTESSPQLTQGQGKDSPGTNTPSDITFQLARLQREVSMESFGWGTNSSSN